MKRVVVLLVMTLLGCPLTTAAQSGEPQFRLGVQFVGASSGEFDKTDLGVSGGVAWHPVPFLGLEANMGLYPNDFANAPSFSQSRVEGFFGMTLGPRLGRFRPFAKVHRDSSSSAHLVSRWRVS